MDKCSGIHITHSMFRLEYLYIQLQSASMFQPEHTATMFQLEHFVCANVSAPAHRPAARCLACSASVVRPSAS
jgi:hypothetical protein